MLRYVQLVLSQIAHLSLAILAQTIAQLALKLLPTALLALFLTLIPTFHAFLHALLAHSKMGLFV